MKGLNHFFAATALAGLGLMVNQNAIASDQPELEHGYCGPTAEINQARKEAGLRFVFGGEADMLVLKENGEPKHNENGEPVFEEKEYLVAANTEGDLYAFMGNADLQGTSTKFCVNFAAENSKVVNFTDTPQQPPYNNEAVQETIHEELVDPVPSYLFAQGMGKKNDLLYTIFVTAVSDSEGKNFAIYSHKNGETKVWSSGDAGRIFDAGHEIAKKHRRELHAGL